MLKALGKAFAELAVLGANQKALVEHFRDNARIMIATEAEAEGIKLQFCSLAINCDLPCNPQRIEQRMFGASDEVLGSIGSGVDFERRIAEIDQTSRTAANPPGALQQGLQAQQEQRVREVLAEKLHWQICQRALEDKRNQLRRGIFVRQDEIDDQRRLLIVQLAGLMSKQTYVNSIFVLQWKLT